VFTPVILPPGLLRLATRPNLTGSSPDTKTIGIVFVAALATCAAGPPAKMTVACRPVWLDTLLWNRKSLALVPLGLSLLLLLLLLYGSLPLRRGHIGQPLPSLCHVG
jgi:hypothetical protein